MSLTAIDQRTWRRAEAQLMGCRAEVLVDGEAHLVRAAFERLHELERAWSRFDARSELNALVAAAGTWVGISADLALALQWCERLHRETHGLFDATIRTALEAWGYDTTFAAVDAAHRPSPTCAPRPGTLGFELDTARRRARVGEGVAIDLGGIGKGLAADVVANELMTRGARAAYICLGGDIRVAGESPDGGWLVPLEHPVTEERFAHHALGSGGLVMSTVALRAWSCGGVPAHHLIDPRTGAPADTDVIAVAVAALSSARAEGIAKAAVIAGESAGLALLRRAEVTAWMITPTGVHTVEASW